MEGSQALDRRVGRYSIAERARGMFDEGQVDLIKATIMPADSSDAELAVFLETCIRNDFDPFLKEIWAIKLQGKVQPVVSVDGLRKKANQSPDFRGVESVCVREYDHFDFHRQERKDETMKIVIDHKFRDKDGKETAGGSDGSVRGPIVGAIAVVRREGHNDLMFFAYWDQYGKDKAGDKRTPWHKTPETMITKAAESVALRKAFNIAGVIGDAEEPKRVQNLAAPAAGERGGGVINWPEDEAFRDELQRRFNVLGYRRAKVRMLVNACEGDTDEFRGLLTRLDNEVDGQHEAQARGVEEPPPPGEPPAEIVDAEPVG